MRSTQLALASIKSFPDMNNLIICLTRDRYLCADSWYVDWTRTPFWTSDALPDTPSRPRTPSKSHPKARPHPHSLFGCRRCKGNRQSTGVSCSVLDVSCKIKPSHWGDWPTERGDPYPEASESESRSEKQT